MGNVIKIGRYSYVRIAKDCNGEEIEAFRRIKKPYSPKP